MAIISPRVENMPVLRPPSNLFHAYASLPIAARPKRSRQMATRHCKQPKRSVAMIRLKRQLLARTTIEPAGGAID